MSIEYKDRGVLHKIVIKAKFNPDQSKIPFVKYGTKAVLAAETTALFGKDLITNRLVGKETHIRFERKLTSSGRYRTHIKLVRAEAPTVLPRGIIHKIAKADRFIEGDVPFKSSKIRATDLLKPAMAAESAVLYAGSAGVSLIARKLRMNSSVSDGGKMAMTAISSASTIHRAWRYMIIYRKRRMRFKESQISYKGKKAAVEAARQSFKSQKRESSDSVKKLRLKKRSVTGNGDTDKKKKIVINSKIKYQKQLVGSEKAKFKNQKKLVKLAKVQMNRERVLPVGAVPILVPSAFAAHRIHRKAQETLSNSDPNNDFVAAADSTARIAKETRRIVKPVATKLSEKRTDIQKSHLHRQENRLKTKNADLKKHKRKKIKANQKPFSQKAKEAAKKAAAAAGKAIGEFVKFAFTTLGKYLLPVIAIIFVLVIILMMFTGTASNSTFVLGTYNASDYSLSRAVEEYTKIAFEFNQNLIKCGTDEWKSGLESFGVNTSTYTDYPNSFMFGRSTKYTQTPSYDFDGDKLAAFMCAYYYEPDENGKVSNWEWNDSYVSVLQQLFDTEYQFQHSYDNNSEWRELSSYTFYGGQSEGYYSVWKEDFYKETMKAKSVPNVIWGFTDSENLIHYDCNTLEILDANNENKRTGYFIQDQRYKITDRSGHSNASFYELQNATQSDVDAFIKDGMLRYRVSDLEILNANDEDKPTGYFRFSATKNKPYRIYSFKQEQPSGPPLQINRSQFAFSDLSVFWVVTPKDTKKWLNSDTDDKCLISFYRKNYYYDDCILYYTVKKKCTFEEAIISVLSGKDENAESRLKFYYMLTQENEEGKQTYGNHQMLNAPVKGKSLQKISASIYNAYGYDMQEWNVQHCSLDNCHRGIDISAAPDSSVYAMCDGHVNWIDPDKLSMSITTSSDIEFWYEGNVSHGVEILYTNISTTLHTGDEVKQGQVVGKVIGYRHCYDGATDLYNDHSTKYYLHVMVKIWYNWGWTEVNPLYMIYRNENEGK